eukprot:15365610-Ditylum_brightwellii.AAC.3
MNYQANGVLQEDTIEAHANLTSATADDRNMVANLTTTNSTLAAQIKALNKHNTEQKQEMEDLKTNVLDILSLLQDMNLRCTSNGNGNRNGFNYQNQNDRNHQREIQQVYYCWSHNVTNGEHHTSGSCTHKKQGCKDNATVLNRMGSSTGGLK